MTLTQTTASMDDLMLNKDHAMYQMYNVLELIAQHGIAIIPNFLNAEETKVIRSEVDRMMANEPNKDNYAFGQVRRLGSAIGLKQKYPNTTAIMMSPFMTNLAGFYFKAPHQVNEEVYVTHETRNDQGLARNGFLHFDRIHTFKFFFYLTDCDRHSGAFRCVPGSHVLGKKLREETLRNEQGYENFRNRILIDYPELGLDDNSGIPIELPAGSLFIFDTDTFHMGGVVEDGRERLVMRGHCRRAS